MFTRFCQLSYFPFHNSMEDFNDLLADFDGYLKAATNGMI